jgi:hypothetical protein
MAKPIYLALFAACASVVVLTGYAMWKCSSVSKKHRLQAHPVRCSPILSQHSTPRLYTEAGHIRPMPDGMDDDKLAPLTKETQAYIHKRQSVPNCSDVQIMISHGYVSGFGSEMHVIGGMLAFALENNHTLVLSPKACNTFTDSVGCELLFQPISSCNYHTIIKHHPNPTILSMEGLIIGSTTRLKSSLHLAQRYPVGLGDAIPTTVPSLLKEMLQSKIPNMSKDQIKFWWRAQSVAYIMRLNTDTIRAIVRLRTDPLFHYYTNCNSTPFPLPANTIAMHIRGGDKWKEMTLVPPLKYIATAAALFENMPLSFSSRNIFVSADYEAAIQETQCDAEEMGLSVIYSRIYRQPRGQELNVWKNQHNRLKMTHTHLLQLLMSLEADSWIGTRASNWNRLIDELRCVWVEKCPNQYTEVGDSYEGYNW